MTKDSIFQSPFKPKENLTGIEIPSKLISLEKAVSYYNNFFNTRIAKNDKDKTRAVWFEFKMLEDYFEKVSEICAQKGIEITRFVFLLGAEENGQRTVLLAPAVYDEGFDIHRAFSLDNDQITFLFRFPGEDYSSVMNYDELNSLENSLILSEKGYMSSGEAIKLYNNYYDLVTGPFTKTLKKDTRFFYYEKGEFEEYLGFLKKSSHLHSKELTGLNILFAAYDNSINQGVYANRVTLFFAPTTNDKLILVNFKSNDTLELTKDIWELSSKMNPEQLTCFFNRGGSSPPPPIMWD